jgi:ABC-type glycerol-3-phosphate transport system permease component
MPILSTIERRTRKGRLLYALIFLLLTAGAATMLYPFALMISGSLRTDMDSADLTLIPAYLVNRETLYRKFLETKYNEDVSALNRAHRRQDFSFSAAKLSAINNDLVGEFEQFLAETKPPLHWRIAGGTYSPRGFPPGMRQMQRVIADRFNHNLDAYSRAIGTPLAGWNFIRLTPANWPSQAFDYAANALWEGNFAVEESQPWAQQQIVDLTGFFLEKRIYPVYGASSVQAYNAAHRAALASYADFALSRTVPTDDPLLRAEWIKFVRVDLNPAFVSFDDDDPGEWRHGLDRQDYQKKILAAAPEQYHLVGPEFAWRDWLKRRKLDDTRRMPVEAMEWKYVNEHAGVLRWEYIGQNYKYVWGELVEQGNGVRNTLILCALTVALTLVVNPLAAYAMSRFRLRGTYPILLVLMATAAFPPMVTLIPTFILLRKMALMNTFTALVLPFAANGYLIFLLKSFFDSLPRELYESAEIDGASELRIFFQITMALSKPILAVVALDAFTGAYTMFMYALIVAPRRDMWLITVWLSQFKVRASDGAMFAAVLVCCVPTLVVFILAQRVILRGIVVPMEK